MPSKELTTAAPATLEGSAIQVELTLPVRPRRLESHKGGQSVQVSDGVSQPKIPRITKLMALAIKFETMVDGGEVRDYADLARLGYVTRARLTQIMNLLLLAPDIQEHLIVSAEGSGLPERNLRSVVKFVGWQEQRECFAKTRRQ